MSGLTVRLVPASIEVKKVETMMIKAHSSIEGALRGEKWPTESKSGVPSRDVMRRATQQGNVGNVNVIGWSQLVALLMCGESDSNGERNQHAMPAYFQSTIVPLMVKELRGDPVKTGADGKVLLPKVAPGSYSLITDGKGESGAYYVWVTDVEVKAKTPVSVEMKPGSATYSLTPAR